MLQNNSRRLSKYLSLMAFLIAFVTTATLMLGDQYGRVNLLYLLVVLVVFPVFSLFFSLYCTVAKSHFSLSSALLQLPFWPKAWLVATRELQNNKLRKPWLFYQSQKLSLMLSIGALTAFFSTLLLSDISFVWRSTILSAEQLFPFYQLIALPWFSFEIAQPMLEQVLSSQDSRLSVTTELRQSGVWWKYVVMAQLFYVLLPRSILFLIGQRQLARAIKNGARQVSVPVVVSEREMERPALASVSPQVVNLSQATLLYWSVLPQVLYRELITHYGQPQQCYNIGASSTVQDVDAALTDTHDKFLVVAAWEPPMGELEDFMRETEGVLLVLDWDDNKFQPVSSTHLDEWRRFCFSLKNWQLQQLEVLV